MKVVGLALSAPPTLLLPNIHSFLACEPWPDFVICSCLSRFNHLPMTPYSSSITPSVLLSSAPLAAANISPSTSRPGRCRLRDVRRMDMKWLLRGDRLIPARGFSAIIISSSIRRSALRFRPAFASYSALSVLDKSFHKSHSFLSFLSAFVHRPF
ncbi:hypothetical protein VTN02DRAFT_2660 [Thermoascus thermophilus]